VAGSRRGGCLNEGWRLTMAATTKPLVQYRRTAVSTEYAAAGALPLSMEQHRAAVAGRFRSVTFLLDCSSGGDMLPSTSNIVKWVNSLHEWYLDAVGVPHGKGVHLLYDREVALMGNGILECAEALQKIAAAARAIGIGVSVSIDAEHALSERSYLDWLLAQGKISAVGLIITPSAARARGPEIVRLLDDFSEQSINLGIIAELGPLFEIGVMESEKLSKADLTWYPLDMSGASVTSETNGKPPQLVRPCFARMRLFVDASGDIYPCLGLVGVAAARVGNIADALCDTGLGDDLSMALLHHWACHGPDVSNEKLPAPTSGLPAICETHRGELINLDAR